LNVLACQRSGGFEIHTGFRQQMLKPCQDEGFRESEVVPKISDSFDLKVCFSF
jgi:hypothetical protein